MHNLVESLDERLVGVLERFDVDDAALGLAGNLDSRGVQHLRVLLEQVVRHVRDSALRTGGLSLVRNAEREHHLAFPQGNSVHDGGLDLLDERDLVVLHEANLRRRLHSDGAGEVQVAELLLEARAHGLEVLRSLGVLGAAGGAGMLDKLDELAFANLCELLLARE